MRWISNRKSITDMEKQHIERKAELKALVDSLFEDERPYRQLSKEENLALHQQAIYGLLGKANSSALAQAQAHSLAAMQNMGNLGGLGGLGQASAQGSYQSLLGGQLGGALGGLF